MYKFTINSKDGKVFEGLSSDLKVLEELITSKVESSKISGEIYVYKGKKLLNTYEV